MNGFALYNQDYSPLVTKNMKNYLGAAERAAGAVDDKVTSMVQSIAGHNPVGYTGMEASAGILNFAQYSCRMFQTLIVSILLPGITAAANGDSGITVVHGL